VLLATGVAFAQAAPPADASAASATAAATPAPEGAADAQPLEVGYGAMPGGMHVPSAEEIPTGQVDAAALTGFGYRKGLLAPDHRFGRVLGDLAAAYTPIAHLTVALALDGRYDRHYGLPPSGDDGYVGDPRVFGRYTMPTGSVNLGGQIGIWIPGKSAPSVAASAISVDGQVFATIPAGPGKVSIDAGFRLDNSAKSVDMVDSLSLQDRVSLGVSSFNEAFGGAHYALPVAGKGYLGLEGSIEAFLGSGSPGQILRGTVTFGYHVAPAWTLLAFAELAKVPAPTAAEITANNIPLIPYEPTFTGGIALQGRFGGPTHATSMVTTNEHPKDVEVIEYADVSGSVTDETGAPVVGAKVTVTLKNHTGTGATDDKGAFTVTQLPIGKTVAGATTLDDTGAAVDVAVDGKKPAHATLTLVKGANTLPKISLEPVLPPGQLRGIVKSLASGKAIAGATIAITPGGKSVQSDADGKFQIDLAPGSYKVSVTAPGLAKQELDVEIAPNGVKINNIDMHK
jgi:hypothetical protein